MKVKIIKTGYAKGGAEDFKPWMGDKLDPPGKNNSSRYTADEIAQIAKQLGYNGKMDNKSFQKWIISHPEFSQTVEKYHQAPPVGYGMPNAKVKDDGKWGVRWDAILNDIIKPQDSTGEEQQYTPIFNKKEQATPPAPDTTGNEFKLKNSGFAKDLYNKRNLPFYQAAPDIASFIASQNTYNYYTPDYTHWEVSPATMNIQPQLNDIDANTRAIFDTTTGNPTVDNIRRQGAYVAAINAKQQPYANKENYDANARYQADLHNIGARNQEQNLDINAVDQVHNNYRALAKDFATGERLRSINSLTKKYAMNERNENMKKLWLDNFFPNITSNGTDSLGVSGNNTFNENFYSTYPSNNNNNNNQQAFTPITPTTPTNNNNNSSFISPMNPNYVAPPQPFFMNPANQPEAVTPILPANRFDWNNKNNKAFFDPEAPIENASILSTGYEMGGYTPIKRKSLKY